MTTTQDKAWQYCVDMNYVHPDDKERSLECETAIAAYVKGYEQARKDTCRAARKSPLTGGELLLLQEKANVTFRGESVTFTKKFYHCVDSGQDFTDTELDDDNMWAIFRAYCEKMGYHSFKDIVLITDIVTVRDAGLSWKDIERVVTAENDIIEKYDRAKIDRMPEKEYYTKILERYNELKNGQG